MMLFPPLSMPSLVVPLRPLPAILRNLLQGLLYVQTRTLKGESRFRAHVSLMLTSLDRYFTYAAGSRLFRQVPIESFRFGSALVPQCWLCLVVAGGGGARERASVCESTCFGDPRRWNCRYCTSRRCYGQAFISFQPRPSLPRVRR